MKSKFYSAKNLFLFAIKKDFDYYKRNTADTGGTCKLRPYSDDGIDEYIVSKAVGNVRNNEPGLIERAGL